MAVDVKVCARCKQEKPFEDFFKRSSAKDGRASYCKPCAKEYGKQYYEVNKEQVLRSQREYHEKNKEQIRKRDNTRRAEKADEINARRREVYHKDPEKYRAEKRADYRKHKEKRSKATARYVREHRDAHNAHGRAWRHRNKEKVRAYKQAYYLAHKEDYAEYARGLTEEQRAEKSLRARAWNTANKELKNAYTRNRRSRLNGVPGTHTREEVEGIFQQQEGKCYYCAEPLDCWQVDHKNPISRPETSPTNSAENLCLTCPRCNTQKGSNTEEEFVRRQVRLGRRISSSLLQKWGLQNAH